MKGNKETKIDQDHPVKNNSANSHSSYEASPFSHIYDFNLLLFSSPFLGKNTGHMSEEKISHAPKPKGFFLPLEITPVKSPSSHVDCAPEYLKCNGNFILSLIGSKGYHVTCSHESQPTTNKKYGGGVVESIKWSLQKE